jgi:hypothetical protein
MGSPAFFGHPCHFDDKVAAGNSSFNAMRHDRQLFFWRG